MLFKCFKYDFKCGILKEYKKLLIASALFLTIGLDLYFKKTSSTVADYFFYLLYGMEEFVPSPGAKFRFPSLWVAVMVYISYITLFYPFKDLNGYGKSILLSVGNKKAWYLSKCMWVILSTAIYFLCAFLILFIFSLLSGAQLNTNISVNTISRFVPFITSENPPFTADYLYCNISLIHFILPVTVSICLNLFQMLLSLFIKPFYSFIFTVSYIICGAYYMKPYMIGNFSMIGRSSVFLANGVDFNIGAVICTALIVFTVITGTVIFSKQDILNKDGA